MSPYSPSQEIIERSLAELRVIAEWIHARGEDPDNPEVILIGGWAVDAYNPYLGSVDIDLVTTGRIRHTLMHYLRSDHNFMPERQMNVVKSVAKMTPAGKIIQDFATQEAPQPFEGKPEVPFTFEILSGNTTRRRIRGGVEISIPTRAMLVVLKMKAAWDRSYRLEHGLSHDEVWEEGKLVKDYADILALIDPAHGGHELDIECLGEHLNRYNFLKNCIEHLPRVNAAHERYAGMDRADVQRVCGDLLSIL
ncbi:hypothetical protein BN140_1663 [Methanoculleus bourgensis MS2]|jgi:hypothetical protein|uniref:Nucleotidyl transferase AbiEii/AbiGii toxin family protein n=1 Tax=Methanoculleus bourgensis (strain ATCC 43281 / DSM 3045 / OCM 15 / MS2) TaxID=1201294 RepID=I7KD86_METBM|nr:hypothetical protein [Methanoculleus bourgensis]CCJ36586.1 hypothetical protein BN140_1663 [Methanoculleus bourgensis MS2]